jgi:O-antigen/teichoic acid export membrane protein
MMTGPFPPRVFPASESGITVTSVRELTSHWSRLILAFSLPQALVQLAGLLAGFVLVRALGVQGYAEYAVAFVVQNMFATLTETGLTGAVFSVAGPQAHDPTRVGAVLATALHFRARVEAIVGLVTLPVAFWMLTGITSSFPRTVGLVALTFGAYHWQTRISILLAAPRLARALPPIQISDLLGGGARLLGALVVWGLASSSLVAVATLALASALQYFYLRHWVSSRYPLHSPRTEYERPFLQALKATVLTGLYNAFQGQIVFALLRLTSNVVTVAEYGAGGRLSALLVVPTSGFNNVLLPRFARLENGPSTRRGYLQVLSLMSAVACLYVVLFVLWPGLTGLLLGAKYAHLRSVAPLMAVTAAISVLVGTLVNMNFARGWVEYTWLAVPLTLATQVVLVRTLDVSNIHDAVLFGLFSLLPALGVAACVGARRLWASGGASP